MGVKEIFHQGLRRSFSYRSSFIFLLLIAITIIFGSLSKDWAFIRWQNMKALIRIAPELGIVTLGMSLLLISGEFDLSVGSIFAFGAMVAGASYEWWGLHPLFGLLLALACGAVFGYVNGKIVTKVRVSSLIVTLGTMWVYRGMLLIITGGYAIYYYPGETSSLFSGALVGTIGEIPIQIIWLTGIAIVLYILLEHSKFGNWILSTGSNKESARMMGINTDRVKIICFVIVGILSAFAGVMQACRIHGAYGTQAKMLNLEAIGASVVGGTSIFGGVGTIPGAALGALIIRFLDNGLLSIGLTMFHFYVALGLVLIAVVAINIYLRGRRT